MICTTLVTTQTDSQLLTGYKLLAQPDEIITIKVGNCDVLQQLQLEAAQHRASRSGL